MLKRYGEIWSWNTYDIGMIFITYLIKVKPRITVIKVTTRSAVIKSTKTIKSIDRKLEAFTTHFGLIFVYKHNLV